jgi:hypothetical protein
VGRGLVGSLLVALILGLLDPNIAGRKGDGRCVFSRDSEWLLKEQPAAYYHAAAQRARKLRAEATTLRLREYLADVIARCERLAGEIQGPS